MKLRRIISALIVFTLVMACAMSAVSAATFTTTTNYTTSGVEVRTDVTGVTSDSMISYVIYDKNDSAPYGDSTGTNIKYIDQKTVSAGGTTYFTVTDTIAKLNGNKILLGSSGDTVNAEAEADKFVNIDNDSALVVSFDGVVDAKKGSVTFFVSQNLTTQTGINVVATDKDSGEEYVFNGLLNLSETEGVYDKYYAIKLVDESKDGGIDFSNCEIAVTPVVGGVEMTKITGTDYWVVSE